MVAYRLELRERYPDWHNAPVAEFGPRDARMLVVGLAPGRMGANRTGRPFTGDDAGRLLYATLAEFGFCSGVYDARADDGVALVDCRITNVLRCVPPGNKPLPSELSACRPFLFATFRRLKRVRLIVALGRVAHEGVLRAFALKPADFPFAHGREHKITANTRKRSIILIDSYHCSRLNTNTGALTPQMFSVIFARARGILDELC
ncbi:uracil-DNA glycosylase [Methylosinus sp. RM1]|uniref:uracil-DNA glycosylase n=1 Tax=Methylosinus sp. RM1 TaxID=2583817 RepID=UPI001A9C5552|nr:uracil-DNA glycosylase [Methylosinus sp. RM1]